MDTVLVGIHAPSIHQKYDAFVPLDVTIAELTETIVYGLKDVSNGRYAVTGLEMLSLEDATLLDDRSIDIRISSTQSFTPQEAPLNPKMTLRDYQVKDGMQLYVL